MATMVRRKRLNVAFITGCW